MVHVTDERQITNIVAESDKLQLSDEIKCIILTGKLFKIEHLPVKYGGIHPI